MNNMNNTHSTRERLKKKMTLPNNIKLLPEKSPSKRLTPSAYTKEMSLTTEEYLANIDEVYPPRIIERVNMSMTALHKVSLMDVDQALFQPFPSELVFRNYTPDKTYKLPLVLFNNDKMLRHLKLEQKHSEYFVVTQDDAKSRVAPGLSVSFTILFIPRENKDYQDRLVFVTEREKFEVPIHAIGPRAILDFRDEIHCPVCPVKASTEKATLVRNIGNTKAIFKLDTKRPFSVKPSCGTLDVGESIQVIVDFNPMTTGDHKEDLILQYNTGEDVYIRLYGVCKELDIHLKPDSVLLKSTYISCSSANTVSITNNSDIPLHHRWTPWASQHEEDLCLLRNTSVFQQEEKEKLLLQCESDPTAIHRLPLLSRAIQECRNHAAKDDLLSLKHNCITVIPAEGEIWPSMTVCFNIIFTPEESGLYQETIYCDITGLESRVPLTIKSEGMGPNVQLNFYQLDMKNVFIGDTDWYEVQLSNKGPIDAPFRLSSCDTTFGRCFSFRPEEGVVPSGACQILKVIFSSSILGPFCEKLLLSVKGQPQPLTMTFRGCVIAPTIHFDVSELNFGDVALGFPQKLICTLFNPSMVPVNFVVRMLGDGMGSPSLTSSQLLSELGRNNFLGAAAGDPHTRPKEFTICPAKGSLCVMSKVAIAVTLCSNTVKRYSLALVVDVQGVGEELVTLPLTARCVVPEIVVDTPVLDFQRCFLEHPYEQHVRLINPSPLPACYILLDQENEESQSLNYGSSTPKGLIHPHSSVEFPVSLLAKALGKLQNTLRIAVLGSVRPPLEVVLSCTAQGPKVHVVCRNLDFGKIPVLTDITRFLHLSNQSPAAARFTAHMNHRKSYWRVEPNEGEVPPLGQLELRVVAHLKDTLFFQDKLNVLIHFSQTYTVTTSATGSGTTIVNDKPFSPSLDLGTHASGEPYHYHFKLTNHGERVHRLYWSNMSAQTALPPISAVKKSLAPGSQLLSTTARPVFSISPARVEIFPGCSTEMVLQALSNSPKVVQELLVCRGIVGNQGNMEHIMSAEVTCCFIASVLSFSSKLLKFYTEKVPGKNLVPLYEKLVLKNVSSLPVSIELSLAAPFSLCEDEGAYSTATSQCLVLGNGKQVELWVCLNPDYCQEARVSQVVDEYLKLHCQGQPQIEKVELHAEIHFPNLHLSTTTVDFGCVLNCTETRRELVITNCSPLPVSYRWTFLVDQKRYDIRQTEMPELLKKELEQRSTVNEAEAATGSSRMLCPPFSATLSPPPGAHERNTTKCSLCVEEVFDVLPNSGHLQPGEQQVITFYFYGHVYISREVIALCQVEEGPTYEVQLKGEASEISYSLDTPDINFGLQLFDEVLEAKVTLKNTGKVGFKFHIEQPQKQEDEDGTAEGQRQNLEENGRLTDTGQEKENEQIKQDQEIRPGQPLVIPTMGHVDSGLGQCLRVFYLPGTPDKFEKRLQLLVAHLPPQEITLTGEGVFTRITLNLPRNLSKECYSDVEQQARATLEADGVTPELINESPTGEGATTQPTSTFTYEALLHMEIDNILVKENALAMTRSLLRDSKGSSRKWQKLRNAQLPEYVLDFGFVIPGRVLTQNIDVTNPGSLAVSFHVKRKHLVGTGFSVDFEQVKNMPCDKTQTITVKFDPQASSLHLGDRTVVMPIQVIGGPVVQVQLCAVVTVPAVTLSTDTLHFDTMQCGMCQIRSVQLWNHESVPCMWSMAEEVQPPKKVDQFLPLYQRKKILQQRRPPPPVFEVMPCSGQLSPNKRVTVLVKFSPTEECAYNRQLMVCVAESNQPLFITAQGKAEEPRLEFCPSELKLGPCLPLSAEVKAEVTVTNPCSFPIEFYSLEFDKQYLEEEKVLRLIQAYDKNNMLLLPPRFPGESLSLELLEYYDNYCSQAKCDGSNEKSEKSLARMVEAVKEEKTAKQNTAHLCNDKGEEKHAKTLDRAETLLSEMSKEGCSRRLAHQELTPVSRAIVRHMGVDLSPEALAACNRRGIAVIVYGAPRTAMSSTAAALGHYYGGACLRLDTILTDVLMKGTSPVSLTARQLCEQAATEYAQKRAEEAAVAHENNAASGPTISEAPHEASDQHSAPLAVCKKPNSSSSCRKSSKALLETERTRIADSLGVDQTTLSSLLPEQVVADILSERLQLSDCNHGVVIDGLESVYTHSVASTLRVVLKAFNNRKYIFVVNLFDSYHALRARERAQREAEEALQKEKVDRVEQWLQDMDEEEYEALPEGERERIDQRQLEQKLRGNERKIKGERKHWDMKKKSGKIKKDTKEMSQRKSSLDGMLSEDTMVGRPMSSCSSSKESQMETREKHHLHEDASKSIQTKEVDGSQKKTEETTRDQRTDSHPSADRLSKKTTSGDALQLQFIIYEQSQSHVKHILQHWDRVQGLLLVPIPCEDALPRSAEVSREKHTPLAKRNKKVCSKLLSPMPSQIVQTHEENIIPHIVLKLKGKNYPSVFELLRGRILPSLEEVLDELGKSSQLIPPSITFSVVPFPRNREQFSSQPTCDCFTLMKPSVPDEFDEKNNNSEENVALFAKATLASKTRSKVTKERERKGRETQKSKSLTSAKAKSKGQSHSPPVLTAPTTDDTKETQPKANLEMICSQSLTAFRWIVPANGTVVLKIWFYSVSPGEFEQIFNFELLGNQKHYQLICRGICSYPSICTDYKTLFAYCKKVPEVSKGLKKSYIISPGFYEFGPLLRGKTRDRYKENIHPENAERLVIHNNSGLETEIQFSFQNDTSATTFLLDPPNMTLQPDQRQELTVWAYPTEAAQFTDSIVCCITGNPELVTIQLSCSGVEPELELDTNHLHFGRTLLHRWNSRCVTLSNNTALPVSWRLHGMEELGDEFSVPQDQGIVSSNSSFPLHVHFKAKKPLHIKKYLRLEVSDVEKILGTVVTDNIHVSAEAYDIALDVTPDGYLDFGTIKVFKEGAVSLSMKNQGRYEIAYKFTLDWTDHIKSKPGKSKGSIFTLRPESGILGPNRKPTTIQIICKPKTEVSIREEPILRCQVIDPNLADGGETIAILAIKVSLQAVFTRYLIIPAYDINFGPLIYGCRKTQSFRIENCGAFETHFSISCTSSDDAPSLRPSKEISGESLSGMSAGVSSKLRGMSSQRDGAIIQTRLTVGMFSVSPCSGTLQPGSHQLVTVDCVAEQPGSWSQGLLIDITDRDPSDHPEGIPYRLLAEVCKPGILSDPVSIFEEHYMCENSSQLSSEQFCNAEGIYVLDENKFIFNKVLVGQTARARFKITNNRSVPCSVSFAIKSAGYKKSGNVAIFGLPISTLCIPSQSHSFTGVNFSPQAMQFYSAVFEVYLEGTSRVTPTSKRKVLEFDIIGEGCLPNVSVVLPTLKNSKGNPLLQFRRVLVGHRHTLPLVLQNEGNVPAQVQIDMLDKHGVFTLSAAAGKGCSSIHSTPLVGTYDSEHQLVHRAILNLGVGEQVEFEVSFSSEKPQSVTAEMSLQVEGTQYCNNMMVLTGEAYQEIITLEGINRSMQEMDQEDGAAGNHEVLNFGDCHVDWPHQESFTMTNHSSSQVMKFEWPPAGPNVVFSPQVGHLHAGCSKEVIVTFCSNQPVTLTKQQMKCKICQVDFQQPLEQVADWDDQKRTVHWLDASMQASGAEKSVKNKVLKTDPEPCCSVVDGSQRELELRVSAICDFVKFCCSTDTIHFTDTLLYQRRIQQIEMVNKGSVKMEFSWQVLLDTSCNDVNQNQGDGTIMSQPYHRLGSVMGALMANPEQHPFNVEPIIGVILPGAVQIFSICFSPLEVAQFQGRLLCSIPNLQNEEQAPCISVCGRSLLPHCHFDLEDSDYISGNSQWDPNCRVIEFNAVGVFAPVTRRFGVVNPTSQPYSFKWRCDDTGGSPFRCYTPCSTILAGKEMEVCFEYVAEQLDVVESRWSFMIEDLSVTIPFLCVGIAREPLVYLDKPHLDLGEQLVGLKVERKVGLVNGEEEPFHFSFVQSSLLSDDQQSSLTVQPMTGTVAPKDSLPLTVSFTSHREGYVSFRLVLRVKRKPKPIKITVKADCFFMSASVRVESPDGGLKEIKPNLLETVDFGKVGISEQASLHVQVTNMARFSLEVNIDLLGPSEQLRHLEAKPQNAFIDVGMELQSLLLFAPHNICYLQDVRLTIKVKHGPTFTLAIKGRAVAPSLEFSFTKYSFGMCFLYGPGMVPPSHTLVIRNKGEREINVQCQFRNSSYLEVDFQAGVIRRGAVMVVPVTFYPREPRCYHEKLTFILNSCITKEVDILGQGVEMKLEVADPKQQRVKLGSLLLGQKVKKQVALVNNSPLDVFFTLFLDTSTQLELKVDLSFSPTSKIYLKACGGSCKAEIQFTPHQHITPFTAELKANCAGYIHHLLAIEGRCLAVNVQLDTNYLPFGPVGKYCQATKKIFMTNTGDTGAKFHWKTMDFPPELSITPAKGYIIPGMEVPFEVTFAPVKLCEDARYENLSCYVEGFSSSVTFTVTGSCIMDCTGKEVVNFVCAVRGSHMQILHVVNPTNQHCTIRPIIEGEQWRAAPSVTLEPLQNKTYELTYRPLTMTAHGRKHQGTVFFSFPDGSAVHYCLLGTAEHPKPENTIVCEMPAKTPHTEILPVMNWLSKQQRFHVTIEILKPGKIDGTVTIKGFEYIDVPCLAKKEYKMVFFTYREGQYNTKVTFYNEESGEYLFYLVTFKATPPGVLSTIELVASVRQKTLATIEVENPLDAATCLSTEYKCLDISAPTQLTVSALTKATLDIEYQPLFAGESKARLSLFNNDLGYFHYNLLLKALPPPPEKTIQFSAPLGSSHTVTLNFTNYSRFQTVYSCKTDCPYFYVDQNVSASPGFPIGSQVSVTVCFEPHQLGETKAQLRLLSGIGGEYIFPLHGICLPPKVQGPFSIRTGRSVTITFKNVFLKTTAFSFKVDNPCFTVKGGESIPSKNTYNILVCFEAPPGNERGPWFGKLTVSCPRSDGYIKQCSWVYYLKGYSNE